MPYLPHADSLISLLSKHIMRRTVAVVVVVAGLRGMVAT
jgi:hypothetical protein